MSTKESTSIGQKMTNLEQEIEWFYGDKFKIDEAAQQYRKTLELAQEIETDLKNLKNEIEVIRKDFSA